ncbi:MAG: outer membrane protein transport protein [Pontiella sp.]
MRNKNLEFSMVMTAVCCIAGSAIADGYRNPPPTAEGIGKSGVNSVFVDDASAISYNPANLALQTNKSVVISATFARTENTYKNPLSPAPAESDGAWNILPNIYYSQPIGENGLSFGLGITTPFGQGLAWDKVDFTPPGGTYTVPYEASVALIDINPTIAFKVLDRVSIGVGLDIYYSQLELKAVNGLVVPGPTQVTFDSEGSGDGWGVGGNIGATWLMTDAQRLTFTYRSAFEIDYSGDFKIPGLPDSGFETSIKLPNIFSLGYGIQLSDKIQVEALAEWLQWSNNDSQTLNAGGVTSTIPNNWDDTLTLGIGGSWLATESFVVRAGYAYLPSPIPDATITHLLPDADRHALSLGLGYTHGSHTFDLAYTFSIYDDRTAPLTGAGPGTYEIDSNLVGMTYSLSF